MKESICKQVASIILVFILAVALFGLKSNLLNAAQYRRGFCAITGKRIVSRSGKILPNYTLVYFELDNSSKMSVAVDKNAMISEEDFEKIMKYVIDGWQYELNKKKWIPERIQNYKDRFFNLKIKKIIE